MNTKDEEKSSRFWRPVSETVEYRVVSKNWDNMVSFQRCKNLTDARNKKREAKKSNPHQGGGYHIQKVKTTIHIQEQL